MNMYAPKKPELKNLFNSIKNYKLYTLLFLTLQFVPFTAGAEPGSLLGLEITHKCEQCGPPLTQSFVAHKGVDLYVSFDGALEYTVEVSETAIEIIWAVDRFTRLPLIFLFSWNKEKFKLNSAEIDPISTLSQGYYISENEVGIDFGGTNFSMGDNFILRLNGTNNIAEPSMAILPTGTLFSLIAGQRKRRVQPA